MVVPKFLVSSKGENIFFLKINFVSIIHPDFAFIHAVIIHRGGLKLSQ